MAQTQWAQVEFMADGEGYGQREEDDARHQRGLARDRDLAETRSHRGFVSPTIELTIVASE